MLGFLSSMNWGVVYGLKLHVCMYIMLSSLCKIKSYHTHSPSIKSSQSAIPHHS